MRQPVGVILAGGQATRMGGGDKGRLVLGDRSLFAHVIGRVAPQVAELALSANGDPARLADLGLPVLPDSVAGHPGPLAGVLAGLDWAAARGATHLVSVAADTPFLPEDLVPRLLLAAEGGAPIVLAASEVEGRLVRQPTFGLWPVALREDLRDALARGVRKVGQWAGDQGASLAPFPADRIDPFFNINTARDLARARALIA
ncbi:molybdenum cofactor guanylyltransferase MobA [Rhodobacteraceae bacterium W635]|uniref:molybdenum cofactor guanylyltransferase MobA n=1 Tax=Nioella halotolerans TaxID=2303578 RepID=UPI000E3E473E|nr:molybdenum cofactor guanylyltransferase MobA [Rhodobacteraceae bacterium W635]